MTENGRNDDRIAIVLPIRDLDLDEGAGIARYWMSPDAVRRWLPALAAAADGLPRLEDIEVRGEG